MLGLDFIRLVDARIESARQRWTAAGTVNERLAPNRATVTFDGSSLAVPVKVAFHVNAQPNSRVSMLRVGSDWVIVAAFSAAASPYDVWTPYVPTFTASAGGAATNNGTSVGRYSINGRTCTFSMRFTWGSTTATGGGSSFAWGLPVARDTTVDTLFSALIIDVSAVTAGYRSLTALSFTASDFILVMYDTTGKVVAPGVPWAWAAGDIVRVSGSYEIA